MIFASAYFLLGIYTGSVKGRHLEGAFYLLVSITALLILGVGRSLNP